ncbi:MAG TPA: hypothetical protein DCY13_16975 [Verrucomicrobiales bacterium]|nr:hypothetical protein [Verrucomicrobiales bacterium]
MNNMKKECSVLATAVLMAVGLSLTSASAASIEIVETYPLNPDGRVHVENTNGRIHVRAWKGEGVKLVAIKKGRTEAVAEAIQVHVVAEADSLKITTELAKRSGLFGSMKREGEVDYTLHLPAGARLETVKNVNGSVTVEGITGSVRASTVNGRITGRDLGGPLELTTVNGTVTCEHVAPREGELLKIQTVNGAIELQLPAESDAQLNARAVNGSVQSELKLSDVDEGRSRLRGRLGEGGAKLELNTVNGGIRLREGRVAESGGKESADL